LSLRDLLNPLADQGVVRIIAILFLASSLASGAGTADDLNATESMPSPVLVELFTAEGCSSCPPADAFLMQLDTLQPIAGAQLIVLSEHMDYWNKSWPDPFASAQLTARQADYVRAFNLRSPYTPQVIVDGAAEMHLNDRPGIEQIFRSAAASPKLPVTLTAVQVESGNPANLTGRIEVDGNAEQHKADVYLAIAIDRIETQVLRGENRGKHLAHVAVVEYLSKIGALKPGQKFSQEFRVPLQRELASNDARIIVFVQESGNGKVVGAKLQRTTHPG
jgi:hypothetical protein